MAVTHPKKRRKPRRVGPLSREKSLACVDRRTKAGRVLAQVRSELIRHLGGDPSPAELLLIENAAMKSCRIALLAEKLAEGGDIGAGTDHHVLAWSNSLRLDLQALGLQRRVKDISPSLADIIREHNASKAAEQPEEPAATDIPVEPSSLTGDLFPLDSETREAAE